MTTNPSPLDALGDLLEERRRFEGWLAQLESRRGDSPARVVDRVRGDYQRRLDGVLEQLRGRASELEASATTLRERLEVLATEEGARRDERAETELRSLVGEFEADLAGERIAACDEAITRLSAEQEGLASELQRVTEVLASVVPAGGADGESDLAATPEPSPMEGDRTGAGQEAGAAGAGDTAANEPQAGAGDPAAGPDDAQRSELAFLKSVVSREPPGGDVGPGVAASSEASGEAQAGEPSPDDAVRSSDLLPPPVLSAPRRPP
ncbi:MAG: hypothetical protein ABIZ91_10275, partial [Gemmatimonadaceae bacterium]